MLRLFLDSNNGACMLLCPTCRRPLLLGAERMGRLLVGYRGPFRIRPGRRALLVCPTYTCDYQEEVEIARSSADAVIYSPSGAASRFQVDVRDWERTVDELKQEIDRLAEQYERGGHPKLLSAIRFWVEKYRFAYWHVADYLKESYREGREVVCTGKDRSERGKVVALLDDGVLLERAFTGETIFLRAGELQMVAFIMDWTRNFRFDFGERSGVHTGNHPMHSPTRFAVVSGHTLAVESINRRGICHVKSPDPKVAEVLGLIPSRGTYVGELPIALLDRLFRRVRYCHVQGHRLYFMSITKDPEILQLGTHDLDTARELKMFRQMTYVGQRHALRWWRYFRRDEISAEEEIQVPIRPPAFCRKRV